jgi:threonine/homoserine/homoserine lactone efflux protein
MLALPPVRWTVKMVGFSYLLWLAVRLPRDGALAERDVSRLHVSFPQGLVLQFANLKAWMLALTLAVVWTAPADGNVPATTARLAIVLGVMVTFGFTSNLSYALLGSLLRRRLARGS